MVLPTAANWSNTTMSWSVECDVNMAAFRDVADKLHYQDKYCGQMEKVITKVQKTGKWTGMAGKEIPINCKSPHECLP